MRILILSKRQYTGKDLLDDRFGRLYEIPENLAARGHEVRGLTLSYRRRGEGRRDSSAGVHWDSVDIGALLTGLPRYLELLGGTLRDFRPDVVWASSDVFHALIAWKRCRAFAPVVIDLYDNYESFGGAMLPGVRRLFGRACREAAALTVVSGRLGEHVARRYAADNPKLVLGNAVRKDVFRPRPKHEARAALGLPVEARLVGTAGAITAQRGIDTLFEAFLRLAERDPALWLVHAGPADGTPARYPHPRIIDLGVLAHERVPELFSALDVAVVCNLDSSFGRFCFPQKFFEILACGTPVVAAAVGEVGDLLEAKADCRFPPGSAADLERCVRSQLDRPRPVTGLEVPDWSDRAAELERFLGRVVAAAAA
ncbi:MAG TPA: glycosyltransferase family 4 protein [Gammaproteobacteria bacterium]